MKCAKLYVWVLSFLIFSGCNDAEEPVSSNKPLPRETAASGREPQDAEPWGGLEVKIEGVPLEDAVCVIVLLHGYGAPGDDLVPLAELIKSPVPATFIFPEAPISLDGGGLAWAQQDGTGFDDSHKQLRELLAHIGEANSECQFVIGGFSQGATMACNLLDAPDGRMIGGLLMAPSNALLYPPPQVQVQAV